MPPELATVEEIDAGGFYCHVTRTDRFRKHTHQPGEGWGPDVTYGLALRREGYQNYVDWSLKCVHLAADGSAAELVAGRPVAQVRLITQGDGWRQEII